MIIERVDRFEDFQRLRPAWDATYRSDPEAQLFMSWKWLAGVLESRPGEWFVLVARDGDGGCLGFLPLAHETVWSRSGDRLRDELEFAGRMYWADYGSVLCHPDHEETVLPGFAQHLLKMNWERIRLKGFRSSDRRYEIFMKPFEDERLIVEPLTSFGNEGVTDNLICPYIDLPGTFEAYLTETLSPNTRQKVRRFLRKVETSSDYRFTTPTAETRDRDLKVLGDLWRLMWEGVKGDRTDYLVEATRVIVGRGLDDGMVHMPILWYREKPVGVLASFTDWEKSRLLFFVSGRDEGFDELPVGLVLHAWNIRWSIEHGLKTYDFLRGDEPYKRSLGGTTDVLLKYPLIRTRSGSNLNDSLDPAGLSDALRITQRFADQKQPVETMTALYQVMESMAGPDTARRLIEDLNANLK